MTAPANSAAALLECVPNLSTGRDAALARELAQVVERPPSVRCLDVHGDRDHNRTVLTFAGPPEAVIDAAVALAALAVARIDLRGHEGVHRRMGAIDVCPFVPLAGATMATAVAAARTCAQRLASEVGLPVFLYGEAATRSERAVMSRVRNRGFEKLLELAPTDPLLTPDCGGPALHPSAGAAAVGARDVMIAFNVDLASADLAAARSIAAAVRESGGGLPRVQAMGFRLASRDRAQVSMNLHDYRITSLRAAYDRVAELAAAAGVAVEASELVGLAPAAALDAATARHVKLPAFDFARHTIEGRLRATGLA
jgi:glutamate formiminotransferase